MIYVSKDARRVISHLGQLGIVLELGQNGIFDVEVACSQFFPNHIIGVIDQVLRGNDPLTKIERAQEQKWDYFSKPVSNMLRGRTAAWQEPQVPIEESWNESWARRVYSIISTAFLVHDINRAEANTIMFDIPPITTDRDALVAAIHAAKDRRVRSVPYLKAILERTEAQRRAERAEEEKSRVPLYDPTSVRLSNLEVLNGWEKAQRRIQIVRGLNG